MAQRANKELVENLRPYIVQIARRAVGMHVPVDRNSPTVEQSKAGVVYWDQTQKQWYTIFLDKGLLWKRYLPTKLIYSSSGTVPYTSDPTMVNELYERPATGSGTPTTATGVTGPIPKKEGLIVPPPQESGTVSSMNTTNAYSIEYQIPPPYYEPVPSPDPVQIHSGLPPTQ